MLNSDQIAAYQRDGYIRVDGALSPQLLARVIAWLDDCIARAHGLEASNEIYDLEDTHTPTAPRVRRIKDPVARDKLFWEVIRDAGIIAPLMQLLGPNLRLTGSKLNMKSAGYGAPVEWHQDWAFYPHTNDDMLAIGIMLDDVTADNGPLMIVPGSHKGPVFSHDSEGFFTGGIEDVADKVDLTKAVPIYGSAGSMSVHHVRAIHGSALNLSGRPRRMLFYEIAAADAWPLWTNFSTSKFNYLKFNEKMIVGEATTEPRMAAVPLRMPGPLKDSKADNLYVTQSEAKKRYFGTYRDQMASAARS